MNMESSNNINTEENECVVREQDRFMPIANVIRIMRKILPSHGKISDDAKETIQECVSEFISFITGEANERCQREQRKTITAEDVLFAMNKLGFDDYIEPLTLYLHRYREFEGERGSPRVGDPYLKRSVSVDYGNIAAAAAAAGAAFPSAFHAQMAHAHAHAHVHHHSAPAGFYGGLPGNLNTSGGEGPSTLPNGETEPTQQYQK